MSKKRKKKSSTQDEQPKVNLRKEVVEIDPELEARILKEADNDFFDEKSADKSRESIFRSRSLKKFDGDKPKNKNLFAQEDSTQKLSHAEKAGLVIAVVMLIYAVANLDKPLAFLALSLLVHFMKPAIGALFGKHNQEAQNALRTFSFVLAVGAILFLFTG